LYAKYIVTACGGFSTTGTGLKAADATSSGGIPNYSVTYKYNMP
jgi:hypothetical protein